MDPLSCYQSEGQFPCASDAQSCECGYNYSIQVDNSRPDPNGCNTRAQCSEGYVCEDGRCLGLVGTPCTRDSECLYQCLEEGGGLFALLFYTLDSQLQPTLFGTNPSYIIGSYNVSMVRISSSTVPSSVVGLTGYSIPPPPTTTSTSTSTTTVTMPTPAQMASEVMLYYLVKGDSSNPRGTGLIDYKGITRIAGWSTSTLISGDLTTTEERLFIWAEVWSASAGLVAFRQKITYLTSSGDTVLTNVVEGDVLYNYNPTTGALDPITSDVTQPGRQYSTNGTPLTISSFSRSSTGDLMVQDRSLVVYVKPNGASNYSVLLSSATGAAMPPGLKSPKYYLGLGTSNTSEVSASLPCYGSCPSWLDVSYISESWDYNSQYQGRLLQFNGNAEGASFVSFEGSIDTYQVENYSIYSDPVQGITGGYLGIVATNNSNGRTSLMVAPGGRLSVIPGYVNAGTQVLALSGGMYLYAPGGCSE